MKDVFKWWMVSTILLISCNTNTSKQGNLTQSDSAISNKSVDSLVIQDDGLPIFYNMYLSVEMSSLFKSIGASYDPKLLSSPDKISNYNVSTDKAIILGVYAVDLSYAKYFEQFDPAGKYLNAMHQLSTDLGIPDDNFQLSLKRIESNLSLKDSLIKIANELYRATETHLKETDRASAAALIVAGGWTEAMFIATSIATKHGKNIELIERIAEQKYSLDNLIELLEKYSKDISVKDLLAKFLDLRASFTKLEVDKNNLDITYKQLNEVSLKIVSLRKSMVR
jgi:hypothetical protein